MSLLGSSLVLTLLCAAVLAVCCLGAGLLLGLQIARGNSTPPASDEPARPAESAQAESSSEEETRTERLKLLLLQLHDVSADMTDNVQEHNERIAAVSKQLVAAGNDEATAEGKIVLQAIASIVEANGKLQAELTEATRTIERQSEELERQLEAALKDALTGISNRRAFDHELDRRLAEFRRAGLQTVLLLLDVDHFKQFNDRYGHQTGDDVLKGVARLLEVQLREVDLPARYGGEEFGIVLPRTSLVDARPVAERVRREIENTRFPSQQGDLSVTVSVGIAVVQTGDEAADLVARADEALYAAKHAGRNCCFFHDGTTCRPLVRSAASDQDEPDSTAMSDAAATQTTVSEASPTDTTPMADLPQSAHHPSRGAHPTVRGLDRAFQQQDSLTGLPNRIVFTESLHEQIEVQRQTAQDVSVVLLEIDRFENLKRRHGREAVQQLVKRIPLAMDFALGQQEMLARFDSAIFALLLVNKDLAAAARLANSARRRVATCKEVQLSGEPLPITLSAGVATAGPNDGTASLVGRSQLALHAAIGSGGNRTFVSDGARCLDYTVHDALGVVQPLA